MSSEFPWDPTFVPPADPAAPIEQGDPINVAQTLWIVAEGVHCGRIGTAAALSEAYPGVRLLEEDTSYDPIEYPVLSRRLRPVWGSNHVPKFSTPEWL